MVWAYPDFPPFHIVVGEDAGEGSGDLIIRLLEKELPGSRYREMVTPPSRILQEMREGRHVCSVSVLRTPEREKFMAFSSVPSMPPASIGITLLRSRRQDFPAGATVSLGDLLKHHHWIIGVARGRSYGKRIDRLLESHPGQVRYRAGYDVYEGLLKMLLYHRVDFILGYSSEAYYVSQVLGVSGQVVDIPLRGLHGQRPGYVACPKTSWGRQFLRKVSRVLGKERPTTRYRHYLERWQSPNSRAHFDRHYSLFLRTGNDRPLLGTTERE